MLLRHVVFAACALASLTNFVRSAWAHHLFQAVIFLIALAWAAWTLLRRRPVTVSWAVWGALALPAWGLLQLTLGWTIYPGATVASTLHWLSLATVLLLVAQFAGDERERRAFLNDFAVFGALLGLLCILQLFTSYGKVLWVIPTDFDDYVYGTFPYYNNYAQFIELALPVALWRATQTGKHTLWWGVASAVMYGSVVASTSRAGSLLCTAEVAAVLLLVAVRHLGDWRQAVVRIVALPLLASLVIMVVGWDRLLVRFEQDDPFAHRREFALAGIEMIKARPLTGFGLGTFTSAYPAYAIIDTGRVVNAAHNDWIEYAADGGILFAACLFGMIVWNWPAAIRGVWGLGLIAVLLHAWVDYPFPRPGVSAWIFALLAAADATRRKQREPSARSERLFGRR